MRFTHCVRPAPAAAALFAALALVGPLAGQAAGCAGQTGCIEVASFIATVTGFRPSVQGSGHTVALTLQFRNKSPRPLVVGYLENTGVATDDRGNRYTIASGEVGGIGVVSNNSFDPRFVLQPGEAGEVNLQFVSAGAGGTAGTSWNIEIGIREIDKLSEKQYRLGKTHLLQFRGYRGGGGPPPTR
jgi:hypothetical protein